MPAVDDPKGAPLPKNQPPPHEEHVWGQDYPYTKNEKYHQCTLPYCREIEVWKV